MKLRELIERPHEDLNPKERETLELMLGAQPLRKALHKIVQLRRDMSEQALHIKLGEGAQFELARIQGRSDGLMQALEMIYSQTEETEDVTDAR